MSRFHYLIMALVALAACAQIASAQATAGANRGHNQPIPEGSVESVGGRLQVILTNTDRDRECRGAARIGIGAPDRQSEIARFEFTLAPQESRLFPLDSQGVVGDQYALSIYEQSGSLILLKNAPVKSGAVTAPIAPQPATTPPTPAATAPTVAKGLTVKARLAPEQPIKSGDGEIKLPAVVRPRPPQGVEINSPAAEQSNSQQVAEPEAPATEQPEAAIARVPSAKAARRLRQRAQNNSQAVERLGLPQSDEAPKSLETPISDEPGPVALLFEIAAPAPITNASLSVSAKDFKQRQAVTIQGSANVEFKLPDDFNEPKINYTLTDSSGKTLITGELDLEALRMEDSVRVSEVKFDQTSYAPGQSAHLVITLEGRSTYGYILDVTAKDENGSLLLDDSRRGIYHKGKAIQEFHVEIPAEAHGAVTVEFKAFGNLTRKLFDTGTRDLIINGAHDDKEDRR